MKLSREDRHWVVTVGPYPSHGGVENCEGRSRSLWRAFRIATMHRNGDLWVIHKQAASLCLAATLLLGMWLGTVATALIVAVLA